MSTKAIDYFDKRIKEDPNLDGVELMEGFAELRIAEDKLGLSFEKGVKYRTNVLPKDHSEEVTMYDLQAQYVQNSDTWAEDSDGVQTLNIRTYSVPGSTEGEYFFTISTDRWAFNNIDELVRTIQEFKNRIDGK